jgi:hypothetical protein
VNDHHDRLRRLHHGLLGGPPTEAHTSLYRAFPEARGYSSKTPDDILFEAAVILATFQAGRSNGTDKEPKVYFLVPTSMESWVTSQLKADIRRIFDHLKTAAVPPEGRVKSVKHVGALFHRIMLGSQAYALPKEPEHWVAFGFSKSDAIPDWMRPKLLDLTPKGCDLSPGV